MDISLAPNSHISAAFQVYGQQDTGNLGVYNVTTGRFYAPVVSIPDGFRLDGRRTSIAEFKNEAGIASISQALDWFRANGWRKVANACNHDSVTCEDAGHQPVTPRKVSGTHAGGCRCLGTHPPGMAGDIVAALWRLSDGKH